MNEEKRDVIEILSEDHREVEEMFQRSWRCCWGTRGNPDERRQDLVGQVLIELLRHAVAEGVVVYPVVRTSSVCGRPNAQGETMPRPKRR